MIQRRKLVGGGLLAGAGALMPGAGVAAAQQNDDNATLVRAIDDFRQAVQQGFEVSPDLERIREQQRTFLKANQKFPDFLEVGVEVWEKVYDWHVRHQQPLAMTRAADGRYVMTVMFTALILRPEQQANYVGFGFDAR